MSVGYAGVFVASWLRLNNWNEKAGRWMMPVNVMSPLASVGVVVLQFARLSLHHLSSCLNTDVVHSNTVVAKTLFSPSHTALTL